MARQTLLPVVVLTVGCLGGGGSRTAISEGGQGAYETSLSASDDGFIVGWHDTRHGNPEIYVRSLDAEGRPSGPERRLTTDAHLSYEPDVESVLDGVAVAWYEVADAGSRVRIGMWGGDGLARWEKTLSARGGSGRNPVLLVSNKRELFIAWLEQDGRQWIVWGRWLDLEGDPIGAPVRVAPAGETTWNLNAGLDRDGVPWVVFDAPVSAETEELFAARVDDDSVRLVQLTYDDGAASKYPDVAFGPERMAFTWLDEKDHNREVYLASALYDGVEDGIELDARRVTRTSGDSIGAYLSWNAEQIGLAWSDDTEGSYEVYFQRFAADGVPVDRPRRLTTNPTASLIPSIEPFGEGFALTWNEDVVEDRGSRGQGGRSEVAFARVP